MKRRGLLLQGLLARAAPDDHGLIEEQFPGLAGTDSSFATLVDSLRASRDDFDLAN
jgi:hypothetical protein